MRRRRVRGPRSMVAALVPLALMAACTSGGADLAPSAASSPASASPTHAEPAVGPPASAADLPGRLLVTAPDGALVTVRPDGSDLRVLAEGRSAEREVLQAAWAPDGSRVAWSEVGLVDGQPRSRVVTTDAAGERRAETQLDVAPFYLSWDPTSSRVAYLGNDGSNGFEMGVVDGIPGAAEAVALGTGAPFYFAWAPEGDRLLAHVGDARVDELGVDGSVERVRATDGLFQAPVWSADGSTQVYAEPRDAERQAIVARDAGTGRTRTIATVDGAVSLVLSPDGSTLAVQALNADERDLYDRTLPQRARDVGVRVIEVASGRDRRVTVQPAIAFSWSPTGDRLAILEPIYRIGGPILFRWVIWDGDHAAATGPFSPGFALLSQYVPFFSQYAQSVSMWAPDGSAFAYPVDRSPDPTSVWIQPVEPPGRPFRLGSGSFVAWAPDAAA